MRNQESKSILRDSFKKYVTKSIIKQDYKQGLSQHKFNLSDTKYINFIREIISEKSFIENKSWDSKKIINDFESNKNHGIIWRICKSYLMLDGFKDYYLENKKNQNTHEQFNLLN